MPTPENAIYLASCNLTPNFTPLYHQVVQSNTKSSRAFGFNSKTKKGGYDEDLKQTPGPCAYGLHDDNKTMKRAPAASMSTRTYIPGDPTQKPGPGAHSPEKVFDISLLNQPRHAFL